MHPTERDIENARVRADLAARQAEAYRRVLAWALVAFGPGWLPSHRHFLVDKNDEDRCRYTDERPQAAATVYTVKNPAGRQRHFTVENGGVVEYENYEAAFGPMLIETHPTRTIDVKGEKVHPYRYSLCWAPIERYTPKTAHELAALRVSRERSKAEREERKFAEENPLLAWAEKMQREEVEPEESSQNR